MRRSALLLGVLAVALSPALAEERKGETGAPPAGGQAKPRMPLNTAFKGRILSLKKRRVTLYYDFSDPSQLEDFEEARPPRFLDASRNRARVEGGRLVLEGSTSVRHKMESTGRIEATFTVRVRERRNVGAVITEPVLSDFYIVYSLFDYRFNMNGAMHIAACGLREDEGAEDPSSDLVNFRDIFGGRQLRVDPDRDIRVEVRKDGWTEFFRVDDVKARGSSKGKTKQMRPLQLGLFVHGALATFDDLTLSCELSEEYLDLENLRAEIDQPADSGKEPTR
jgi:hypothetical protein